MRRDADSPRDIPHSDFSVQGAAQKVFARVVPVDRSDPCRSRACGAEVGYVLAVLHVVDGDYAGVAGCGETFAARGEGDGADWFC